MQEGNEKENVLSKTQPDDKQSEYRSSRFSVAFHILLPVAGLTLLLFGKKQLFTKLMLQLDRNCVSVLCPSLSKREKLLKWACNRLPSTWSSSTTTTLSGGVAELWKDGSLLCTLLNTAIPGACPNPHRHWNQPLTHAQAIVYKYLGVASVFTDEDLSESLSSNLESKFINYLNDIQQSMEKLSESSEKEKKVTSLYIARGMGLFSGEQHKKAEFYIYPNDKTDDEKRNVIIQIKGPYGTFGEAMIPEFREKLLKIPEINIISDLVESSQFLKPHPKSDFMEKFSKYFKKYHVKHLGENIVLDVIMEEERAKVTYIPKHYGMYEINLISDGELIKGCPFNVHIFSNDSVEETFDHDDKYEETRPYRRRKVISQTIDLIDEEIPLSEFEEKYQAPEPVTVKEDSPEKSNLNFREVVEELTKNSETIRKKLEGDNHQVESEVKQPILMEEVDEPDSVYLENRSESLPPKPPFPEIDHISSVGMETLSRIPKIRGFGLEEIEDSDTSAQINFNVEIQMPVIEEAEEQETLSNVDDEENIDLTIDGDDITLSEKCKDSSPRDEKKESYAMSSEYEELSEYHNSLLKCKIEEQYNALFSDDEGYSTICEQGIYQELFSRINVEEENIDLTTKHKFETTESKNCQEVGENQDSQAKSMMGYHDLTPQTNVVKNHVLLQKDEENIFKSERYTEKYENLSPKNEDAVENSASTADKELLKSQNESRESEIGESNAPTTENELFEQHQDPYSQSITEVIDHAFVAEDSNESSSSNLENIDNMAVNPREELFTNDENDNIYDKLTTNILENENQVLNNDQYPVKYQYYSVQSRRDHIMCNVNDNNDNSSKQEISTCYNSKMKSQTDESTYTDKTIINSNESTMGNNKFNLQIGSKHINVNVNRIKIPERFKENPKDTVKSTLEHFKYFRKNMPSPGISNTVISNGMKNYKHRGFNEENTPKKFSSKSFQSQDHSTSSHSTQSEVTSPICHDHIVPEVVYSQMLVANRRKMFAQSSKDSITSSKNSSFSEAENTDGSRAESNYGIEGLSVLNVLESLKQSITSSSDGRSIISSTKSFPDVSLESDGSFTNLVREKKSFWEKVSLGSSRSSDYPTLPKKTTKKLSEYERCRLIWKKPTEIITEPDEVDISRKTDIYRSADDILSMTASMTQQNMKNCKSLDNSLNECEMLTIEERKQMLLKQNYDLEKRERERLKSLKRKSVQLYDSLNNDNISKNGKIKSQIHKSFSPIMEKIKKFNSDCNLSTTKEENNNSINLPKQKTTKPNNAGTDSCRNDSFSAPEIPPKRKFSSQFKRAITFFQKLEEKSQSKTKPKKAKAKHFSLNINSKKGRNRKRGGSLNLTNISDRFSVDNIYEDVIGNKKGSFKGRPNRTALVEALATFSRKENYLYDYSESEDDIKYDMFKNHVKRRKRKSIKSIFDVYY